MLVFENAKHIEAMLNASLLGSYRTQIAIEDYGYAFSLIHGNKDLGYACFYYSGGSLCVAVEFSSYDSMLFGEMYDNVSRDIKKRKFITFCQENGIDEIFSTYWLTLLERIAIGEKISIPDLSGSTASYELQVMLTKARREILGMDDEGIYTVLCELHLEFVELEKSYPFGYSHKPFLKMGKVYGKRGSRFNAYVGFFEYLGACVLRIRQAIENEVLRKNIKEQLIKR